MFPKESESRVLERFRGHAYDIEVINSSPHLVTKFQTKLVSSEIVFLFYKFHRLNLVCLLDAALGFKVLFFNFILIVDGTRCDGWELSCGLNKLHNRFYIWFRSILKRCLFVSFHWLTISTIQQGLYTGA